jgi:glycosyltransferase involved in cell wall biosynthesis
MKVDCTIILTTYNREEDCKRCLSNLIQKIPSNTEIILLDEWHLPTKSLEYFCLKNGINYLWTGIQKKLSVHWRVPGFALNIGAKRARGEYLIIGCAEILVESQNIVKDMVKTGVVSAPKIYDLNEKGIPVQELNSKLPFFLGLPKSLYIDIGGYDEDFTGYCFDDNDFSDRILSVLPFERVSGKAFHVWNVRGAANRGDPRITHTAWEYNRTLYESRKGTLIRNTNKSWGML